MARHDEDTSSISLLALGLDPGDDGVAGDPALDEEDAALRMLALGLGDTDEPLEIEELPEPDLGATRSWSEVPMDRYETTELLGRGGMADVRLAHDRLLERDVAMKIVRVGDPALVSRFLQEARITGQLEHPNIIPVHDLGVGADGRRYFTMKRVKGLSLAEAIADDRVGSVVERLDVYRKICDAVAFAHARGVIHRDLKPANIMIGAFGEVQVMDWGLAKLIAAPEELAPEVTRIGTSGWSDHETHFGTVMGTPSWMSPEQARGETDRLGPASDIYSLGGILYLLLAGVKPHEGSPDDVVAELAAGALTPPSRREGAEPVERELEEIILHAMEHRPGDRYTTVEELRGDVQAWLEGHPVSVVEYTALERLSKWMGRHRAGVRGAAIAAAVALVLIALGTWRYVAEVRHGRDQAVQAQAITEQARREADRNFADAQVALATVYVDQGRTDEARAMLADATARYEALELPTLPAVVTRAYLAHRYPEPLLRYTHPTRDDLVGLALSPDRTRLVITEREGEARLVSLESGAQLAAADTRGVERAVAAFPGGDVRLLRQYPDRVEVLDLQRGETLLQAPISTEHRVFSELTQDGESVVITDLEEGTHVLRVEDGSLAGPPLTHAHQLVAHSGDGAVLAGYSFEGSEMRQPEAVSLWETRSGRRLGQVPGTTVAAIDPAGTVILHEKSGGLALTEIASGAQRWFVDTPPVDTMAFSADEPWVAVDGFDGLLRRYALDDGHLLDVRAFSSRASRRPVHDQLVAAGTPNRAELWSLSGTQPGADDPIADSSINAVAVSRDGLLLLTADWGGHLRLFERESAVPLRSLFTSEMGLRDVVIEPAGRRALGCGRDGDVTLWNLETGAVDALWEADEGIAMAAAFVPGEERALVGYESGVVAEWDLARGEEIRRYEAQQETLWDVALSPDGRWMLTTGRGRGDPVAVLVERATGEVRLVSEGWEDSAFNGQFSPDGTQFATGTHRGRVLVGSTQASRKLRALADFGQPVMAVAYSPDGTLLAAGTYDGRVHLLQLPDGTELQSFELHHESVHDLVFTGDTVLVSADESGRVAQLDLALAETLETLRPPQVGPHFAVTRREWLSGIGQIAALQHDWHNAVWFLERARSAGAEVAPLQLGRALWALGRYEEARSELRAALDAGDALPGTLQVWMAAEVTP